MENELFPKVYIVILNWNGWKDTIECLESIFRNDYPNYQVVVCDNASSDDSLSKIKEWAQGNLFADKSDNETISQYTYPPIRQLIAYAEYNRSQAETFVDNDNNLPLILIQTGDNLGFAGGCNVGMRYALSKKDFSYIWLLNNDTVIENSALRNLVNHMRSNPKYGICGSTLLYYDEPTQVQSLGGTGFNKWFGISKNSPLPQRETLPKMLNEATRSTNLVFEIEKQLKYITGASMLVSRDFLQKIGLMEESYFLYYEEIDWATRAKEKYKLGYSIKSIVYHKGGKSTGTRCDPLLRSEIIDFYFIRSRILFTRKFHIFMMPTVYLGLLVVIFKRIRWGKFKMAITIIKSMAKNIYNPQNL